jgi:hypothetical protein
VDALGSGGDCCDRGRGAGCGAKRAGPEDRQQHWRLGRDVSTLSRKPGIVHAGESNLRVDCGYAAEAGLRRDGSLWKIRGSGSCVVWRGGGTEEWAGAYGVCEDGAGRAAGAGKHGIAIREQSYRETGERSSGRDARLRTRPTHDRVSRHCETAGGRTEPLERDVGDDCAASGRNGGGSSGDVARRIVREIPEA